MLLEWLQRLLTPCPRHLRQMGYLRELLGIHRRYHRWRDAWEPHCRGSSDLIRRAMARCSRKKKAVLFGSGWLYDIPLADVAGAFEKVILVDLLHPFATRRAVRRYSNVTLLSADIT